MLKTVNLKAGSTKAGSTALSKRRFAPTPTSMPPRCWFDWEYNWFL